MKNWFSNVVLKTLYVQNYKSYGILHIYTVYFEKSAQKWNTKNKNHLQFQNGFQIRNQREKVVKECVNHF